MSGNALEWPLNKSNSTSDTLTTYGPMLTAWICLLNSSQLILTGFLTKIKVIHAGQLARRCRARQRGGQRCAGGRGNKYCLQRARRLRYCHFQFHFAKFLLFFFFFFTMWIFGQNLIYALNLLLKGKFMQFSQFYLVSIARQGKVSSLPRKYRWKTRAFCVASRAFKNARRISFAHMQRLLQQYSSSEWFLPYLLINHISFSLHFQKQKQNNFSNNFCLMLKIIVVVFSLVFTILFLWHAKLVSRNNLEFGSHLKFVLLLLLFTL